MFSERIFDDIDDVPTIKVGLLLGTSPRTLQGSPNLFFRNRMMAAARLYREGKIQYVLASGDNSDLSYNEPIYMQKELIQRGVPKENIILDYAGFSTLDSVIRAKEVFGQHEFIVISQQFHNERAVYIARWNNIDAYAYNADPVNGYAAFQVQVREYFARLKALFDVHILKRQPRFLGHPEIIPN